jgi:hypothetical protein
MKKLEALTNVAIIFVAILASAALFKYLRTPAETRNPRPQIEIGSKVTLKDVDWRASRGTLVMAIATTCHYCTDSAPFYRRLAAELPKTGIHLLAVLPQSQAEGIDYLKRLNVEVADVRQGSFPALKVSGTPTLILVDRGGVVRHVWFGRLQPDKEEELVKLVKAG